MDMAIAIGLFVVGLILLIKGGDWFVDGATGIARRFHLPEILIGATVVSIGTTLPEVMVSATAAAQGTGSIAYGNAIGSIICNTSLIAAITIAIKPAAIDKKSLKIPVIFFFGAAALYCGVAYITGHFTWYIGLILLAGFVSYITLSAVQARKQLACGDVSEEHEEEEGGKESPLWKEIVLLVVGAALIAVGARLLVDKGMFIAKTLGVPETVIALTFVALGTSLPELVTAITSLAKGHGALSLGNIIGANLFNLVFVSGVSIVIDDFQIFKTLEAAPEGTEMTTLFGINSSLVLDIPVMLAVMLLLTVPALIRGKLSRFQGIALLAIYAGFCVFQFVM